jgi:brefeldin A-inhibited guanine nucleotide-exchange protein
LLLAWQNPALLNSSNRSVSVDFMSSNNKKAQQEEHHIRTLGLECLTSIMRSLEISAGLSPAGAAATAASTGLDAPQRRGSDTVASTEHSSNGNIAALALDAEEESNAAAASAATSPNSALISGDKANSNIVDVFDKKQKFNEELETGILKFNLSQKTGLAYLAKTGHLELTPKSVASFFHQYQDRLDKTAVGDYLGREREYQDGFCLRVLSEYVDMLEFADMPFDLAIRCAHDFANRSRMYRSS